MDAESLSLLEILLLIIIPGAFGGFCFSFYELFNNEIPIERTTNYYYLKLSIFLLGKSLIGVAGAFGVVLIAFCSGKISADKDVLNQLFLISFCVIGGTISYRALPRIGRQLEQQIENQIFNTKNELKKEVADGKEHSIAISSADTALATKNDSDVLLAIERLEKIKKDNQTDRTLHIYLGRLYRVRKDYNQAITTLRGFIDNLHQQNASGKKDPHYKANCADALYNIACYHSLKAKETHDSGIDQGVVTRLKHETIDILKESISLLPSNLDAARKDPDFDFMRENSPDFNEKFGNQDIDS